MGRLKATNMSLGIGAAVRRRRVEAGIRQDHLAERVGISASHLSRFERGKRHVSLATLDAIVRALLELGVDSMPELTTPSDLDGSGSWRLRSRQDETLDDPD